MLNIDYSAVPGVLSLGIILPEGKTNKELLLMLEEEFASLEKEFYGTIVEVSGRITVMMAAWLGHKLAHICKEVRMFDPKENEYVEVITH